uniref:Uncharacterized protein n=1 Tax=Rangifer tarandus platyrhynchus TaxID=3082113 RepID=A0ACB0FGC0_RANTA|nr:unnamed protein product [Rangifer tarandus platyrhynchus]
MRGAAGSRDSDRRLCRAARRPGRPPGGSVAQAQEERETEAAGLLSSTRKSAREESAQPGSARRAGAEEALTPTAVR